MALVKCKECGEQVSTKAVTCPKCGAKAPKKTSAVTWLALIIIIVAGYTGTQTSTSPSPTQSTSMVMPERQVAQAVPALAAIKIDTCLQTGTCLFQLRGEATPDPTISFIITKAVWSTFNTKDKEDLRTELKRRMSDAQVRPERYTDIPASAPFHKKALENIKMIKQYSVILSRGKSPNGSLYVDEEILVNF